jgi:hypothetical protein
MGISGSSGGGIVDNVAQVLNESYFEITGRGNGSIRGRGRGILRGRGRGQGRDRGIDRGTNAVSEGVTHEVHIPGHSQFEDSGRANSSTVVEQRIINGVQNSTIPFADTSNCDSDSMHFSLSAFNEITNSRPPESLTLKPPLHSSSRGRPKKGRNKHPIDIFINNFRKRRALSNNLAHKV